MIPVPFLPLRGRTCSCAALYIDFPIDDECDSPGRIREQTIDRSLFVDILISRTCLEPISLAVASSSLGPADGPRIVRAFKYAALPNIHSLSLSGRPGEVYRLIRALRPLLPLRARAPLHAHLGPSEQ